jgi:hypothetical protein
MIPMTGSEVELDILTSLFEVEVEFVAAFTASGSESRCQTSDKAARRGGVEQGRSDSCSIASFPAPREEKQAMKGLMGKVM